MSPPSLIRYLLSWLLAIFLSGALSASEDWISIRDRAGRSIEASVLEQDEARVKILRKRDRTIFEIRLDELSPETQAHLAKRKDRKPEAARPIPRELPNLLYNPAFAAVDWFREDASLHWMNRDFLERKPMEGAHGGYVLRAEGPAEGYTFQDLQLVPGTAYRVVCRFRGEVEDRGLRMSVGARHSDWAEGGEAWTEHAFTFVAEEGDAPLRLEFALGPGELLSVDRVSVAPVDGGVPKAPAPVLKTPTGSRPGPIHVGFENPLPGATIRYTVDGSDPHEFSTPYTVPFVLHGPAEVRAAVFRGSHERSDLAGGVFEPAPQLEGGVPFHPVGWGEPVETWWERHPYNPAAPGTFDGPVASPEPRIDVAEVRAAHPESTTAGIEEALALLPKRGGTLWFPKSGSPYTVTKASEVVKNYYLLDAPIHILRRSNIHFLSDGATIEVTHGKSEGAGHPGIFAFCSMEYADNGEFQNPIRNFYFKGLTFDGTGDGAVSAFLFRHCADILFEDCTFTGFKNPTDRYHPGLVNATSMTDNIWMRRCRLDDAKFGVYWDGVHNGGFVDCEFGPGLVKAAVLLLTNNDMVHYSAVQRSCQYIVLSGSRFESAGESVLASTAANVLVEGNAMSGKYRRIVQQTGRGRSNMRPFVRYNGGGFQVLNNRIEDADTFAVFQRDCAQFTRHEQFTMDNRLSGNRVGRAGRLLVLRPRPELDRIANIELSDNRFEQVDGPLVEINGGAADRISDIRLEDNETGGFQGNRIEDDSGTPMEQPEVRFTRED